MNNKKHPIVFIHGMWSTPEIWATFRTFYQAQGYTVYTPTLRHHHDSENQNKEELAKTGINDYLDDLTELIDTLDEKPILIGHSMGALLALQLASRGLAAQAVLLSPLAPAGFFNLRTSILRTFSGIFTHWGFWKQSVGLSSKNANYGVLNRLPDEARAKHHQKMVDESGRAISQVFFWLFDRSRSTRVRKIPECPMLVMVGRHDKVAPPEHSRNIARDYCADYMLLEEHGHWLPLEANSERVAEQSEIWLTLHD